MKKYGILFIKICIGIAILLCVVFAMLYTPDISPEELNEKYEFPDSQWIDIDGVNIHYRQVGEGSPIVLVHGFGGNLRNWEDWTNILQDSFSLISYDLPGYGLTGATREGDYSDGRQVQYLKSLTTALGIDSFVLAGNSMGGAISWKYAIDYPDDVTDLILIDAGGYRKESTTKSSNNKEENKTPLGFRLLKYPALKSLMTKMTPAFIVRKSLNNTYTKTDIVTDEEVEIVRDLLRRPGSREVLFKRMNAKWDSGHYSIQDVAERTLIMWGEDDNVIPVENAYRFEKDIEEASLIIYKEIGHLPMDEIAERTAADVRSWLLN